MKKNQFNQSPDELFQKAIKFHQEGKLQKAEELYLTLTKMVPNHPVILSAFSTVLMQQNKSDLAISYAQKSLDINPQQPELIFNLGIEYQKLAKLDLALECYKKCEGESSNSISLYLNIGNTLKDLKRFDEAVHFYDKALALKQDFYPALWNKALAKLTMGDFKEGWELYESGWAVGERKPTKKYSAPLWNGVDSLEGKKLYVHLEQGLGDSIQFCRYIPLLEKLGATVFFEVQSPLLTLLKTLDTKKTVLFKEGNRIPEYDYAVPLISLPYLLKTDLDSIPNTTPYLSATAENKKYWEEKLGEKSKPRIGITWSGSKTNSIDNNLCARRHLPLKLWEPILSLPFEFHGLQKDLFTEDQSTLKQYKNLIPHHKELTDFANTAGLVEEMDLVISVCTSVAHLSGALNHPAWIMIPYSSDFRWLQNTDKSPWYSSIKLFRKEDALDWTSTIQSVADELRNSFLK
jgi:tetratricopeptide (TPR) repeat protein